MPGIKPPFDVGMEGAGTVVKAGKKAGVEVGTFVLTGQRGAFTEYQRAKAKGLFPLPKEDKNFIPIFSSGLTAIISLNEVGEMKSGQTILVTAAAGATGLWGKTFGI